MADEARVERAFSVMAGHALTHHAAARHTASVSHRCVAVETLHARGDDTPVLDDDTAVRSRRSFEDGLVAAKTSQA